MKYFFYIIILVACLAVVSGVHAAECRSNAGGYCLQLKTTAATITGFNILGDITKPGQLVSRLYTLGLSLVGLSALMVVIWGGILYMTAGDSKDRAQKGRNSITNAVFGLVLALLSYLILYTINPALVKDLNLNLTKIKDRPIGVTTISPNSTPSSCTAEGGKVVGSTCIGSDADKTQKITGDIKDCTAAGGEAIPVGEGFYCSIPFK